MLIDNNLAFQRLIVATCGAGFILLLESEYSCLKLFKKKMTLFFFICQIAILSSATGNAFSSLLYFLPKSRNLLLFIIISLIKFIMDISYPMMILLRLKFVYKFHPIVMFTPLILNIILIILKYFWIKWALTNNNYGIHFIIQPTIAILLTIQNIIVNVLFIMIARKKFENIIYTKSIIIVNIIVIIIQCITIIIPFLSTSIWNSIYIISQIEIRLEIIVLAYIVLPFEREQISNLEFI